MSINVQAITKICRGYRFVVQRDSDQLAVTLSPDCQEIQLVSTNRNTMDTAG